MGSTRQDIRRALQALAFRQAGYFTTAQALELGYSYQNQRYHVVAGNWERVGRGLLRLPDWPVLPHDGFARATAWSQGLGVISHDSALAYHGLSLEDPAVVHLTVPPSFKRNDPQVRLHHHTVPREQVVAHHGWRVTTPFRTLVDVASSTAPQETLDQAVAAGLERGLVMRRRLLQASADANDYTALRLERAVARSQDD